MVVDYNFDILHIKDNERVYFNMLEGVIASVDEHSTFRVDKSFNQYLLRISPLNVSYINSIISQINDLNNALQIKVEWGKSFKNSSNIFFSLSL